MAAVSDDYDASADNNNGLPTVDVVHKPLVIFRLVVKERPARHAGGPLFDF